MLVLIHSSKTMRASGSVRAESTPELDGEASELAKWLKTLSKSELGDIMELNSEKKVAEVHDLVQEYDASDNGVAAIEGFVGDIYSGLQLPGWGVDDLQYAHEHMRILSGLYGILRPLDGISPYRLEMGYKFRERKLLNLHKNMYEFWGGKVSEVLPKDGLIIDLTAKEYSRVIKDELKKRTVIEPKFLTVNKSSGEAKQVIVHTKVARGAFARWIIQNRIEDSSKLKNFAEIGYKYSSKMSTGSQPVFIAKEFKGIGLSIRLLK